VTWPEPLLNVPEIDALAPLIFVVNAAAGTQQAEAQSALIQDALGGQVNWYFLSPII
jgi:hypothetical protein